MSSWTLKELSTGGTAASGKGSTESTQIMRLLRCKLFNAHSLCNKLAVFHMLLNSSEYNIIFVTESWPRSDFSDSLLLPNSIYAIFRKDRGDGYGGVAVFVKTSLRAVHVDLDPVFLFLECIVLDVLARDCLCMRLVCIYMYNHLYWQMTLTTLLLFADFWTHMLTQKGVFFMLVTSIIHALIGGEGSDKLCFVSTQQLFALYYAKWSYASCRLSHS